MSNVKNKSFIIDSATSLDLFQPLLYIYSCVVGGLVLYSKLNSIKTNYNIKKDFQPKAGYIVTLSDECKKRIEDFNMDEIAKIKHSKEIIHFIDVVRNNFKEEDLAFMVNNLNKLKVYNFKLEDYLRTDGTKAYYNSPDNSIFLHEGNPGEYIYHELFHAASTIGENGIYCVGFANYTDTAVGVGINEGYTQLLTCRYFPTKKNHLAYPYLTKIACIVEKIIGRDEMQSMYMKGELNLLFNKLSAYSSNEDAYKFVALLDSICSHLYKFGLNAESKEILNQALYEINVLLVKFIINKIISEYNEDKLNINYIYEKSTDIIHMLPSKLSNVYFKCNFWNEQIAFDTLCDELKDVLDLNSTKTK